MSRTAHDATSFFRNIDRTFSALNEKLEKSVQDHLRNVYGTLAIGLTAAAMGAGVHLFTDFLRAGFMLSIVSIGLMWSLITTPPTVENQKKRLGFFIGFCAISGISTGPLLEHVIRVDPSIVLTALLSTVVVFGAFSMAALHAHSTKYLYLGGTLASASLGLLGVALLSMFTGSAALHSLLLWGGLAISSGFILYDTQMIIEKNRRGDDDFIWHSVDLFLDFIQVFRYILILLSQKKENEKRKSKD